MQHKHATDEAEAVDGDVVFFPVSSKDDPVKIANRIANVRKGAVVQPVVMDDITASTNVPVDNVTHTLPAMFIVENIDALPDIVSVYERHECDLSAKDCEKCKIAASRYVNLNSLPQELVDVINATRTFILSGPVRKEHGIKDLNSKAEKLLLSLVKLKGSLQDDNRKKDDNADTGRPDL